MIKRSEFDVSQGMLVLIDQKIYRNAEGDVIILDADESPPNGFDEFDQGAQQDGIEPL